MTSFAPLRPPLRLCVKLFLALLIFTFPVTSQTPPDLTTLEPSVREQITAAQTALAAVKENPATTKPALSDAYGKLGQIYHAYSLIAAARDCYVNANTLAPQDFRWLYLLARLDQQEGRYDVAIRRYDAARSLRPDYVATFVNLGNIFLELNRLEDARRSFSAALQLDANNPAAHYGLAQVSMSQRNYAEAVDHFEQTLAQVPAANRVHYSLAMAYRGLGNLEKVKEHLAQQGTVGVRVADPLFDGLQDLIAGERVYLARGKIAFEARRFADAAAEFRKAIASQPESLTARINLGAALTQLGDVKGAIEQFEAALQIDPRSVNAHYNLAVLLAGQKNHEQSISHLRSALSVADNDLTARLLLAQELKHAGRTDEALPEFARVVQADSNNEEALLEQVKLLYGKKQFRQALESLERGHAQHPQKGRTIVVLAYLLAASPETDLRNGARALELAQRVYTATGAAPHGALVALSLAELGRCREASDLQQQMITLAEQQGNTDLRGKLQADLKPYDHLQSCRPGGETQLRGLLFDAK
jgi:tetratricopeptide (TPR) repeat protein